MMLRDPVLPDTAAGILSGYGGCQKGYQRGNPADRLIFVRFTLRFEGMSKRFQMVGFRGSTQEKSLCEIFRCG
jgi:hypothetical protein